ncbi:MAG: cupin domain-containing protein [Thermoanaerobaculia bacterium]|nr:cupin domain-containing protein [Thermoanaerobaculia bacterium]
MIEIQRRAFLGLAVGLIPFTVGGTPGSGDTVPPSSPKASWVGAGLDLFDEPKRLGPSTIDFKASGHDTGGSVLVIENTSRAKGGPARHLHLRQDEFFYVLDGEYVIEVGDERFELNRGDSLLAPRQLPHVWAYVGDQVGRLLITFTPAGEMEAFFREVSKANAMPPRDPALWRAYGMELVGPPLSVS